MSRGRGRGNRLKPVTPGGFSVTMNDIALLAQPLLRATDHASPRWSTQLAVGATEVTLREGVSLEASDGYMHRTTVSTEMRILQRTLLASYFQPAECHRNCSRARERGHQPPLELRLVLLLFAAIDQPPLELPLVLLLLAAIDQPPLELPLVLLLFAAIDQPQLELLLLLIYNSKKIE